MPLYALVPAAGRGQRFGGPKLLTRWKDRELLGHVLAVLGDPRLGDLVSGVFVVHRPDDVAVKQLALQYRARPVAVPGPGGELSDTLRAGFAEIAGHDRGRDPAAILICLGDQPLLRPEVIRALAEVWRAGGLAVRPTYHETPRVPGHPMLIDRSLWPLANELVGVAGFAQVLKQSGQRVDSIVVPGRNPDIDTTQDLLALDGQEMES